LIPRSFWLLLVTLLAFGWRMDRLGNQSLWRDEVDAIFFATRHLPDTLVMFVQAGQNGPLYFVALRPWFSLVGASEFALRLPSAMAGALATPLIYQVARRLLPTFRATSATGEARHDWVPLAAAALYALNPYHLWYGQEGKMYSIITVGVLLATWWWLEGMDRGGWRPWLAYTLTVTVTLYSHLLIILLYPLHFFWFWLAWPQAKRHWRGYALALAGLTLPYLPMLWWQWDLLTADRQLTGFSFTPLEPMLRSLLLGQSRGFAAPPEIFWLAPIFFLGLAGLLLGWGEVYPRSPNGWELAPWRRMALLLSWLLLPIAGIYLMSLRQPIFTDRYLIWIAPAALLLLALGLRVVRQQGLAAGPALAALLLLYILGAWTLWGWEQKGRPMKYDLRAGVQHVWARRQPDELLILHIPHLHHAYRYYSSDFGPRPFDESEARLHPWAEGIWTNQGWPDETLQVQLDAQMQALTAGYSTLWVLRSEVEMWDQRHLMAAWLDQHASLVEQADYTGVQVRKYQLHPGANFSVQR
jgi:mannosyltransferase